MNIRAFIAFGLFIFTCLTNGHAQNGPGCDKIYPEKILLFHGFMSSPEDLAPLKFFLEARGFAAETISITGLSRESAEKSANLAQWEESVRRTLKAEFQCAEKIWIVAYSMGANLIMREYMQQPTAFRKIAGIILLAPFFTAHPQSQNLNLVLNFMEKDAESIKIGALKEAVKILKEEQVISDSFSLDWTGDTTEFSLSMLREALRAQTFFSRYKANKQKDNEVFSVPIMLAQSRNDEVADYRYSEGLVINHFTRHRIDMTSRQEIGHRLMNAAPDYRAKLFNDIAKFIEAYQ